PPPCPYTTLFRSHVALAPERDDRLLDVGGVHLEQAREALLDAVAQGAEAAPDVAQLRRGVVADVAVDVELLAHEAQEAVEAADARSQLGERRPVRGGDAAP